MVYKIGICDDEISTCSELEIFIAELFKNLNEKAEIYVWHSAEVFMEDVPERIDLNMLFLDIELPKKNGVDVGRYIRNEVSNQSMHIIYISSKKSYAYDLFEIHPYDFLIKPIDKKKVCSEIKELLSLNEQDSRFFTYEYNRTRYTMQVGNIIYFMSDKHTVKIICKDGEVKFIGKLKEIIHRLPSNFCMIGQSYIVNIRHIKECHSNDVIMDNNEVLKISRSYKKQFSIKMIESNKDL